MAIDDSAELVPTRLVDVDALARALETFATEPLRDELADVLLYLVRLASVLGVDLDAAARHKLAKNALKYPIATAYGSSKKYTEL